MSVIPGDVRVLAVPGDPADLAVLASVVAQYGLDLLVVDAGPRLLDEILRYRPDVIVLDVAPAEHDVLELCAALKSAEETCTVPVILTSTTDSPDARRRALEAGCDDYFEKPVNRHLLAFRIRSLARLGRDWARSRDADLTRAVARLLGGPSE